MPEIGNFLVPDATFAIEMLAFVVVLVVVTKFVLPRIRSAVEERKRLVSTALAAADDADRRHDAAEQEAERILTAARRLAREITEKARATADYVVEEGGRTAHAEYVWLVGRAARETEQQAEAGRRRLRREAAAAAAAAAGDYLGQPVDAARLAELVDRRLRESSERAAA